MTRHANYQIHNNLIKNKVDFRLIGLNESMTDLPEHSHMKNKKNGYSGNDISVDKCRGMRHGSSVFCSEENLIQQWNKSKYSTNTKDIFIHETLMLLWMMDWMILPKKRYWMRGYVH